MSPITKKYKSQAICLRCIDILLMFGPMVIFLIMGFMDATSSEKVVLGITTVAAVVLTAINVLMKYSLRSTVWILLLGLYYVLDTMTVLILIIAITNILDELIIVPLYKSAKNKYTINKEIDKRV